MSSSEQTTAAWTRGIPAVLYALWGAVFLVGIGNWLVWRSLKREMQRLNTDRLSRLIDELVATAEEAAAAVAERTELLQTVLAKAEAVAAELRLQADAASEKRGPAPVPATAGTPANPPAATAPPAFPPAEPPTGAAEVQAERPAERPAAAVPRPRAATPSLPPAPAAPEVAEAASRPPAVPVRDRKVDPEGPRITRPEFERVTGPTRVKNWEPAELAAPEGTPGAGADTRAEIYALADAGHDAVGIARKLGMTRGEVELILGLRRLN
jgi:hypothetical protein